MNRCVIIAAWALGACAAVAAEGDWQTITTTAEADGKKCSMKVPADWKPQDKGASFSGPFNATLIYEAEKPDVWWTKRKKVDFKDSRMFQDNKTNYWIEIQGALITGGEDGSVHIAGVRADNLVCHAVLEFKAEGWREKYDAWQQEHGDMVRQMMTSLAPAQM